MLKFNSSLQALLDAAHSKTEWITILVNALGTDLKIRCKRSADASSTTVFATGVEFFNASIEGAPVVSGGSIVKFGKIYNATIHTAANLSTGASVLRIEGGGNYLEGTLGLLSSSCDFKASLSFTDSTGLSFDTIVINPPRTLPSGTGAAAPALDANAPAFIELEDWTNPSSPKSVKKIPLDTRIEDYVYQDDEMAAEIGDVRVTQSSQTIVYGRFEFGVTMLSINPNLNLDVPGVPVHQVMIAHKPYGTWPTYPWADTFRRDRDTTYPKPYKIKILKADNTILKTIEMRDGLPINSPDLAQDWGPQQPKPLRPHFECGQLHVWNSSRLKYRSNASKYFPGVTDHFMRESLAKDGACTNAAVPLADGRSQWNSTLHYYAAPEWPIQYSANGVPPDSVVDAFDTFDDPYLYDIRSYHQYEGHRARISGWNVEPGSISLHDWYCGPGGVRHDRSCYSTPLVRYFTRPNGFRLKGNVSHRVALDAYNQAYFHHSHHWFTDVKKFKILPKELIVNGDFAFTRAYYGVGVYTAQGLARSIDLAAIPNGGVWNAPLRDGHRTPWNAWARDDQHSYYQPGTIALLCNSVAHGISGQQHLFAHIMGRLGSNRNTGNSNSVADRVEAWNWWQFAVAWKVATTHSMGIDRESIEKRFQIELETHYDNLYAPYVINNQPDDPTATVRYNQGIKRFGMPIFIVYGINEWSGYKWWHTYTDSKVCYFAGVLQFMRQTGFWAAMSRRSEKCATYMRWVVQQIDKTSIDSLYYTKGRYEYNDFVSPRVPYQVDANGNDITPHPEPFADWNEWVTYNPADGLETLMTDKDGTITASKVAGSSLLRFQWAYIRRDYFPELPHPLLTDTCAMIQKWNDDLDVKIKSISNINFQRGSDYGYGWPPLGIYKPPVSELGPYQ